MWYPDRVRLFRRGHGLDVALALRGCTTGRGRVASGGRWLMLLLVLLGLFRPSVATARVDAGELVPDLTALALDGAIPVAPGKVVLLDVWASWCAPCKASFPALSALQREFGEQGLVVLGVSVDRKERDFRGFVQRLRPEFAVVRDATGRFAETFAPPAMPTSYLIDRWGRVRGVHTGFHGDRTVERLRTQIQQLLEETP